MDSNKLYSFLANFYEVGVWLIGYKRAIDFFVSQLPVGVEQPLKILEAGCGTGLYSIAILKRFPHANIVAFDRNAQMVKRTWRNIQKNQLESRARVFVGDIQNDLPEPDNTQFDVIITGGVLEYVPLESTVKNLSRFLKQGGFFINSAVRDTRTGIWLAALYGCRPYSRQQNIKAFTDQGFLLTRTISSPWFFPMAIKELFIFQKL